MPLEYTSVPPVPRGMNLAGPPVFIDDSYCRWMQDTLVDRPGQIRMRGPFDYWLNSNGSIGLDEGEQILGATETYIGSADGNPVWRGAVFVCQGPTDATLAGLTPGNTSLPITSNGFLRVFKNINNTRSAVGEVFLPFAFNTQYNTIERRWVNNTVIDAKPALGGGVWIGIIDDFTNATSTGTSALFYWRGAGLPESTGGSDATYDTTGNLANRLVHASNVPVSGTNAVEAGMFAFRGDRYLGIVAKVSGTNVDLEKNILANTYTEVESVGATITYRSVRGFVHQYGRGFANYDGGAYITSGGIGTDAEGLFKAARLNVGGSNASNHKAFVYRNSDNQFVGKIKYEGVASNTQIELDNAAGSRATNQKDYLQNEAYFVMRDDDTMFSSTATYDSKKHSMLLANRRPDQRPGTLTLSTNTKYPQPAPGIFNSTYAGRQWFASFNTTDNVYDTAINRVVFSSTDNCENINLCQDAADSIIIPGRENIIGIAGSNAGLLVFVESKTYIIRGTSRQNFSLEELYPDGCLSTSSIVQVGGGVIWAGKYGIYYFDGATVRNFTPDALGVYYTDGIREFDIASDRVYAFVFNNYLIMNFTKWFSNYTLNRWQSAGEFTEEEKTYTSIEQNESNSLTVPDRITFSIYLPTGSIGTLSNFTPRGYMDGIMATNMATNSVAPPTGNKGTLINLKSLFTENIDDQRLDGGNTPFWSNDSVYSTYSSGFDSRLNGPDFYIETKQYNFSETTLRKWWRKLLFNISVNQGSMLVEFVDINNNSLVSPVTNSNPAVYNSSDESGFYLIGSTTYPWSYYEDQAEQGIFVWDDIENTPQTWLEYFAGVNIRYSRWLGIRKSSLGFRVYSLRGFSPDITGSPIFKARNSSNVATLTFSSAITGLNVGENILIKTNDPTFNGMYRVKSIGNTPHIITYDNIGPLVPNTSVTGSVSKEVTPEIVNISDWVWGLKPLRAGRN